MWSVAMLYVKKTNQVGCYIYVLVVLLKLAKSQGNHISFILANVNIYKNV